ncbi:dehydration-induced 19 homolog 3-like protein [Tanacetum coccineum]|uniref:Dehydration-induced 19 homolog 3-like protein n=1 Tax=Tanacetum coccineum TaxID=301880 RepID=A0ABQ5B448_9ASTR
MLEFLDKKDHGLCKRKFHDDESFSIISLLRKKLQEHSRSLQKESTSVTSSTNSATDPLLLSFVYNPSQSHEPKADSYAEPSSSKMFLKDNTLERSYDIHACTLLPIHLLASDTICSLDMIAACEDHEEKARKKSL